MKISAVLKLATVQLLLFINAKNEVRYAELSKLIQSRGTLTLSLKELDEEGLISRRVVSSKPIQTYYSLTKKGSRVALLLIQTKETVSSG